MSFIMMSTSYHNLLVNIYYIILLSTREKILLYYFIFILFLFYLILSYFISIFLFPPVLIYFYYCNFNIFLITSSILSPLGPSIESAYLSGSYLADALAERFSNKGEIKKDFGLAPNEYFEVRNELIYFQKYLVVF